MAWRRRGLALLIVLTGVAFLPKSAQFAISAVRAQHLRRELQGAVLSPQLPSPLAEFSAALRCRPAGTKMAAKKPTELEGGGAGGNCALCFRHRGRAWRSAVRAATSRRRSETSLG